MDRRLEESESIRAKVRDGYGQIARQGGSCCGPKKSCCGSDDTGALAESLGYSENELAGLPEGANLGLSCGNPSAIAALQPGEVVLDLGSGGGFDVFVAGKKVGPRGRAIGVDMTPDMLAKARGNIAAYQQNSGLENVEFRLGEIEHLPVADNSVDAIISNCVINLSPDKPQVWREMVRVLKPGGRVAVSDLALIQPIPESIADNLEALLGCIAGAVLVGETEAMARAAGLAEVVLTEKAGYVDAMIEHNAELYREIKDCLPAGTRASDFVVSLCVTGTKAR